MAASLQAACSHPQIRLRIKPLTEALKMQQEGLYRASRLPRLPTSVGSEPVIWFSETSLPAKGKKHVMPTQSSHITKAWMNAHIPTHLLVHVSMLMFCWLVHICKDMHIKRCNIKRCNRLHPTDIVLADQLANLSWDCPNQIFVY